MSGFSPVSLLSISFLKGDQWNNAFNFIVPFDCVFLTPPGHTTDSVVNQSEGTEVSDNKINWRHVTFFNLMQQNVGRI